MKIRGYRIELGEIENALREQPGVRNAVVSVRDVVGVIQRAAVIRAIARDLDTIAAEIGDEAALLALQADDFEYYLESGDTKFPVTAGSASPIYQTVVVLEAE